MAEIAWLKASQQSTLKLRISERGAVSGYGLGRFPVTLYGEQWLRVLDMADEIRAFIAEKKGKLSTKPRGKG